MAREGEAGRRGAVGGGGREAAALEEGEIEGRRETGAGGAGGEARGEGGGEGAGGEGRGILRRGALPAGLPRATFARAAVQM